MVEGNNISFAVQGQEIIRLTPNGDIFVKGKLVKNDLEVVDGLREFLVKSGTLKDQDNIKEGK